MGSYGIITSLAVISIATLPLIWAIYQLSINAQTYTLESINKLSQLNESEKVDIKFINNSIQWINTTVLRIKVLNKGAKGIHFNQFKHMTLIIDYISSGERIIKYIPYNQSGQEECWKIIDAYQNGYTIELANPLRILSNKVTGIWDPGEVVTIEIRLNPSKGIDTNTTYTITLSTLDGVYTMYRGVYK